MPRSRGTNQGAARFGAHWAARGALLGLACSLLLALSSAPVRAEEVDARPGVDPSAPTVDLDNLLKLPEGFGAEVETRQGATKVAWLGRFERARKDLDEARVALARVERELESASGSSSSWQVSAPGASNAENSPLSFKLRQDVKEQRALITDAERRLRALEVEADLASVPRDWRL
jgi:hypothetical protein